MLRSETPPKPKGFFGRLRSPKWVHHAAHYERVLGTSFELQLMCDDGDAGPQIESDVLAEVDRLESALSLYRPHSEFNLWQTTRNEDADVSDDLADLLEVSEAWRSITNGIFQPAVEELTEVWRTAEKTGTLDEERLREVVSHLQGPLWTVNRAKGTAQRLTPFRASLNSIAKGYIVDRASEVARTSDAARVRSCLVNIGGDLSHFGPMPLVVDITDPRAADTNSPPVSKVRVCNESVASSGDYRRGFLVGDQWHSHIIDPRTGYPCRETSSASVIAETAATADVLATAFSLMPPEEAIALADENKVSCLLVTSSHQVFFNDAWQNHAC